MKKLLILGLTFLLAFVLLEPPKPKPHKSVRAMSVPNHNKTKTISPPKSQKFKPIIEEGGKDLEYECRAEAIRQLRGQGQITEGTILHEATHFLNAKLTQRFGYSAFYLWNENRYLVMPKANFTKITVAEFVPMDTISKPIFNNYFGSLFVSRDAIHIIEDFDAELNGFEADSPDLLRDMLIYSVALGLEMKQQGHEQLRQYQAGDKFLIERSVEKAIIDLTAFRTSSNPKAVILRKYLKDTYGESWTREILNF